MDSKTYSAILQTICYADVFDYPLKEKEVRRWVKEIRILHNKDIKKANGVIFHKDSWMFLKDRENLIARRKQRETISKRKLVIAKRAASLLVRIPTIKLVGISGSLAMNNAQEGDDIDFFIVAKQQTLWFTRLLAILIVELFAKRRRPNDNNVTDKICLNMFVDEKHMAIPKTKQNIYTAHEVCQLKVLYEKENTHGKFLIANEWVKAYLPNGIGIRNQESGIRGEKRRFIIPNSLLIIPEALAKHLQLWYMHKRRSSEQISDHYLAFHPKDYTHDILAAFEEKIKAYGSQV